MASIGSMFNSAGSIRKKPVSITQNIQALKSIPAVPDIPPEQLDDYYREPVDIEYYIPKESRFEVEQKYLYIPLMNPRPKNETQEEVMKAFMDDDSPIDVMEAMNRFPIHLPRIITYFENMLNLHEAASMYYRSAEEDPINIRRALYLNEILSKFEPSVPGLEILGDYTAWNINWCVRQLNKLHIKHSLEDRTVATMIARYRRRLEESGDEEPTRFKILAELYFEQAFPINDDDD